MGKVVMGILLVLVLLSVVGCTATRTRTVFVEKHPRPNEVIIIKKHPHHPHVVIRETVNVR